jgi:hypothetical protein
MIAIPFVFRWFQQRDLPAAVTLFSLLTIKTQIHFFRGKTPVNRKALCKLRVKLALIAAITARAAIAHSIDRR